jgi:heme exporter protein D
MNFDSLGEFVAMGGHGFYVWLSYALALGVVVFNIGWPLVRRRRFLAAQRGRLRRAGEGPGETRREEGTAPDAAGERAPPGGTSPPAR